jgi:glycosyltransferase involved in cell wall biosynthesis
MKFSRTVSIIIPTLNEEETIGRVIDEIPRENIERKGYQVEVMVVDNDSTDKTREIAAEKGATVIVESAKGKGRAIRTAFGAASGDFIFMLDADYTYPATYIPKMLEVLQGGGDVVIGSRLRGQMGEGAMSKLNKVGNRLLAFMANTLYRTRISDLCTGYWGFTKKVVNTLELSATGFELEAEMFVEITKKGYKIAEVPIYYRERVSPSKLRSLRDGLKIGKTLIIRKFR